MIDNEKIIYYSKVYLVSFIALLAMMIVFMLIDPEKVYYAQLLAIIDTGAFWVWLWMNTKEDVNKIPEA